MASLKLSSQLTSYCHGSGCIIVFPCCLCLSCHFLKLVIWAISTDCKRVCMRVPVACSFFPYILFCVCPLLSDSCFVSCVLGTVLCLCLTFVCRCPRTLRRGLTQLVFLLLYSVSFPVPLGAAFLGGLHSLCVHWWLYGQLWSSHIFHYICSRVSFQFGGCFFQSVPINSVSHLSPL